MKSVLIIIRLRYGGNAKRVAMNGNYRWLKELTEGMDVRVVVAKG